MKCKHPKVSAVTRTFQGGIDPTVARWGRTDPRSHGNVSEYQLCIVCGAHRTINSNAGFSEMTVWIQ
jgi:hypothetical protein